VYVCVCVCVRERERERERRTHFTCRTANTMRHEERERERHRERDQEDLWIWNTIQWRHTRGGFWLAEALADGAAADVSVFLISCLSLSLTHTHTHTLTFHWKEHIWSDLEIEPKTYCYGCVFELQEFDWCSWRSWYSRWAHTHWTEHTPDEDTHTHTLTRTHSERLRGMKRTDSVWSVAVIRLMLCCESCRKTERTNRAVELPDTLIEPLKHTHTYT